MLFIIQISIIHFVMIIANIIDQPVVFANL